MRPSAQRTTSTSITATSRKPHAMLPTLRHHHPLQHSITQSRPRRRRLQSLQSQHD
jgi:hypothetical protein